MTAGKFDFGFAVDWMRKDLAITLQEARKIGAKLSGWCSRRSVLRRNPGHGRSALGYFQSDRETGTGLESGVIGFQSVIPSAPAFFTPAAAHDSPRTGRLGHPQPHDLANMESGFRRTLVMKGSSNSTAPATAPVNPFAIETNPLQRNAPCGAARRCPAFVN
jgi:hypothetical protein